MKKNLIIIMVIAIIVVGAGSFYGGVLYQKSKSPIMKFTNGQNRSFGSGTMAGGQGNRNGGNFISGEIIAKDEKSVTVKVANGGSKIVLFSTSTEVGKFTTTTPDNLAVGENVMINGKTNSDGSIVAQSIQLRQNIGQQLQGGRVGNNPISPQE